MPFGNSMKICPEGHPDNSPAFQRRDYGRLNLSPEGTVERERAVTVFQPSLRDFTCGDIPPSVETLGYFHLTLRDIHFQISERH